ncbi:MAG: hypothetical protein P8N76_03965 [Pirellulaceae bacterium]|nr:hypothetical protein [Pirellulaceae bacterium]
MTWLLCTGPTAVAQRPQAEIALDLARRMDANRDGILQESEIPPQSRRGVLQLARDAGLQPDEPIPIDRLRKYLKKGKLPKSPQGKSDPANKVKQLPEADSEAGRFGRGGNAGKTQGFGVQSNRRAEKSAARPALKDRPATKNPDQADSEKTESDERDERAKNRIRKYARIRLKRYDKNQNGVLERDEWSKMSGDPKKLDANGDGILTTEEVVVDLTNYGKKTPSRSKKPKVSKTPKSSRFVKRKTEGRETYRFKTPSERISGSMPRRLQDWFLRADEDGDGQVAMEEFASFWSASKAAEFIELDLNNDGVITPSEYVAAKETNSK